MCAQTGTPSTSAKRTRDPDRYSSAGATPEPWEECARIEYGGDRSHATTVRTQVLSTLPEGRSKIEDRLLNALAVSGRTDAGLAFVCQMLALVGSAKCVPALASLMKDQRTAEAARYALELIPGSEASTALRDALTALSGAAKAGVIGSLAARGDAAARPALTALQATTEEPTVVREAAARALAHLGKQESTRRDAQ